MQTVIFGRPGCPYCVRAKDLAEKLSNERDDFQYQYVYSSYFKLHVLRLRSLTPVTYLCK